MKNLNIFSLTTEYDNAKSGGILNVPNVSFVDEDSNVRYLLKNIPIHNGYEYVDLGLPSGLKWATCNVGADSPEQAGLYFAWGETVGYTADQVTGGERVFSQDVYNAGSAASISTDLTLEQDAAHVNLGGDWRMPTKAELEELRNNCTFTWTADYNGTVVKGRILTSKINGNSIFLPVAGVCNKSSVRGVGSYGGCWSASWGSLSNAWILYFSSGNHDLYNNDMCYGRSVRGVFK